MHPLPTAYPISMMASSTDFPGTASITKRVAKRSKTETDHATLTNANHPFVIDLSSNNVIDLSNNVIDLSLEKEDPPAMGARMLTPSDSRL
jgi:hypothetical protein